MPWLTVSVMPHQPTMPTPKRRATAGSTQPMPNSRKWCRAGVSTFLSARTQKGASEAMVARCFSAMAR
jgi:hypothetical protein